MKHLILAVGLCLLFSIGNLTAQGWTQKANYPAAARNHPICFAIDNYGYLTTGLTNQSTVLNDFLRYDITTDQWEVMPNFPGAVRGLGVGTQLDGKGYIGFGLNGGGNLNDLWEYDPATETWTELASCPCDARAHPAFVAVNGKIFVGLGDNGQFNFDDWWEYDIATDTWTRRTDFPGVARHHPFYFAIGDYAYVGMGHGPSVYNDWYRYDPATDTWLQLNDLPDQGRVAGTHFAYDNKGYILAGEDETHSNDFFEAEFWEYDPDTDSWVQLPSVPIGDSRWAPGSFVIDSSLFFTSGENSVREGETSQNDVWLYPLRGIAAPADTTQDSVPDLPASIALAQSNKQFSFYPNPTNGVLTINQAAQTTENVVVFNLQGRLVATENGGPTIRLDLSDQPQGLYILQVGTQREKFVLE